MSNPTPSNLSSKAGPLAGILGLLFVAFMAFMVFSAVKGVFSILSMVAIPLFVLAMILDFSTVKNYFSWVANLFKKDLLKGILAGAGTYLGFPLVSAYLAFKAFSSRQLKKVRQQHATKKKDGEEYIKYEEVKNQEQEDEDDFLELEDLDKPKRQKVKQTQSRNKDNDYDDLFA